MDRYRQLKAEFLEFEELQKPVSPNVERSSLERAVELARRAYGKEISPDIEQLLDEVLMQAGHLESAGDRLVEERTREATPVGLKFLAVLLEAYELFRVKNRQYGNAIVYTGVRGSVVALTGDTARLRVMLREPILDLKNLQDKLMDILVQAGIGLVLLKQGNIEGEEVGE